MADKKKKSLDRWLDRKMMKSEEIKSSIHKLKSEAHSEGVQVSKDGKDEGKGRVIKLPSIKLLLIKQTGSIYPLE